MVVICFWAFMLYTYAMYDICCVGLEMQKHGYCSDNEHCRTVIAAQLANHNEISLRYIGSILCC